ncbi:6-phosphogluconolactonase [Candidatus Peribacteria bacterium RIFCSPHIGHO2_02_FULL_52_16]|nr:MAG: 6-phosphogluconolactonase [Candidatus Peribacteria bacterium RIFCSPHIGHO2_01_FULL_51_35]OGJ61543.1 MAG: 6-phosphogluconolactonase [Candidatus Peribacteria bacterium RIFCSPHIGHO2_02_FULL_52_16]
MIHPTIIKVNADAFAERGCSWMADIIKKSIADHGRAAVGLSGGSTPGQIYDLLGKEKGIDWSKVSIFLVDDRYIREDDPKSNQFLLRSTLLKHAPVPESQIIFPDTTLPYEKFIDRYEKHLRDLLKKNPADLVTLGLGPDGHIASLFPPVPEKAFGNHLVIGTTTDRFDVRERISVTLPVLTAAREAIFFLKGKEKEQVWNEMMESSEDKHRWPAKALSKATVLILD